jgi:hypothetical protein
MNNPEPPPKEWYLRPEAWAGIIVAIAVTALAIWLVVFLVGKYGPGAKRRRVEEQRKLYAKWKKLIDENKFKWETVAQELGFSKDPLKRTEEQNRKILDVYAFVQGYGEEKDTLGDKYAFASLEDLEKEKSRTQENLQEYQTLWHKDARVTYNPLFLYESENEAHERCESPVELPRLERYEPKEVPDRDPPSVRVGPHYMPKEVYDNWNKLKPDFKENYLCRLWRANTRAKYLKERTKGVLKFDPPPVEKIPDKTVEEQRRGHKEYLKSQEEANRRLREQFTQTIHP